MYGIKTFGCFILATIYLLTPCDKNTISDSNAFSVIWMSQIILATSERRYTNNPVHTLIRSEEYVQVDTCDHYASERRYLGCAYCIVLQTSVPLTVSLPSTCLFVPCTGLRV